MPFERIGHWSAGTTQRDELDPPDPAPRAQELEQHTRSDLLDRSQRANALLGHERAVRLEVPEVGQRHDRATAHHGPPLVPLVNAHESLDAVDRVVRGAQQLEVVAGVLDERSLNKAAEGSSARRTPGRRGDAAKVLAHQRAALRRRAVPGPAGKVGDCVGGPRRSTSDNPSAKGSSVRRVHRYRSSLSKKPGH